MTITSPLTPLYQRLFATISLRVNMRAIFSILIAAAMLFAPLAMQSGAAMAMTPTDHHAQMVDKGHCGTTSSDTQDESTAGNNCCVAMCAAVAIAPGTVVAPRISVQADPTASLQDFQFGFFGELPTPPPRVA